MLRPRRDPQWSTLLYARNAGLACGMSRPMGQTGLGRAPLQPCPRRSTRGWRNPSVRVWRAVRVWAGENFSLEGRASSQEGKRQAGMSGRVGGPDFVIRRAASLEVKS